MGRCHAGRGAAAGGKAEAKVPTPTTPSRATAAFPPRPSSPIAVPAPPDVPPPPARTSRHVSALPACLHRTWNAGREPQP